jgi:hypothetical protein
LNLAAPAFDSNLPKMYIEVKGSRKVESILDPVTDPNGTTVFDVKLSQKIKRKISTIDVVNIVRGISIKEAYEILIKKFGDGISPIIEIKPSWWPRMPFIGLRIVIID